MKNKYNHRGYCTPYQLKLPLEISKKIKISDPVYTFCEVFDHIDLNKYLAVKESGIGRKRYDSEILLKVILFAFMEFGYVSTREIERLCNNDIRFMWLLQDNPAPSHMTIDNFMRNCLSDCINDILDEINSYIFEMENVDLSHIYIDGTKIVANANRYSWVWKKSSKKNRQKTFNKITALFQEINSSLMYQDVEFEVRTEYTIEYMELIIERYIKLFDIQPECIVRGRGHHKTDNDATFFRMKRDYMGNDQLLPGYNIQLGVCDEYIAVCDVKQYASDMDCFIPLMEKFKKIYGFYPKYPVADAGYGSFNNYLYCEEHGMEKYMKFTMFEKESKDEKYRDNPYRAVNFPINENGKPVCPNGKEFNFLYTRPVKGNKYGRTEELYQCEDCTSCEHKEQCCKCEGNRTIRLNEELTSVHQEVLSNLNSTKGALLRMNRSIDVVSSFSKQLKVPVDILIKYDLSTLSPDDTYMLQFLTVLAGKTANNEIHWNLIPRDFFSEVMQGDYQHELFEIHMSNYYEYTSRFFDGKIMDIEGDALKVYINKTEYVCLYRVSCSTDERSIRDYYYELYLESDSTEKKIEPLCNALMGDKNSVYFEILDQLCDLAIESTKKVSLKSTCVCNFE